MKNVIAISIKLPEPELKKNSNNDTLKAIKTINVVKISTAAAMYPQFFLRHKATPLTNFKGIIMPNSSDASSRVV